MSRKTDKIIGVKVYSDGDEIIERLTSAGPRINLRIREVCGILLDRIDRLRHELDIVQRAYEDYRLKAKLPENGIKGGDKLQRLRRLLEQRKDKSKEINIILKALREYLLEKLGKKKKRGSRRRSSSFCRTSASSLVGNAHNASFLSEPSPPRLSRRRRRKVCEVNPNAELMRDVEVARSLIGLIPVEIKLGRDSSCQDLKRVFERVVKGFEEFSRRKNEESLAALSLLSDCERLDRQIDTVLKQFIEIVDRKRFPFSPQITPTKKRKKEASRKKRSPKEKKKRSRK